MGQLINKLEVEISNDPINGLKRKLVHDKLLIEADLEMKHFRKIVYYEKLDDGTPEGAYGRTIAEVIQTSDKLTAEAKQRQLEIYQPVDANVDTIGVMVDPTGQPVSQSTVWRDDKGNIVAEGTDGATQAQEYPAGSKPELLFWQNLPIAIVPGATLISQLVYGSMQASMKSADKNGRV